MRDTGRRSHEDERMVECKEPFACARDGKKLHIQVHLYMLKLLIELNVYEYLWICLKTPIERGSEARFGRGWHGWGKTCPYFFVWVGPYLIS
jgi:hypothetical protein